MEMSHVKLRLSQVKKVSSQRLSVGMTPKTLRLLKPSEMLLSVHGSPFGVYKENNMEAIYGFGGVDGSGLVLMGVNLVTKGSPINNPMRPNDSRSPNSHNLDQE
ncbi:hypothetical protein Ahy_B02g057207 [Arachis hypogaea]|uniref:Uncharacterized protein n=1 Tax=Arachis hypogaea TaxID=3818 RepID=A0A445AB80_ARAHY|nr:hypothetical protein Ahy_B02g057207 [Arachis hypogaea]